MSVTFPPGPLLDLIERRAMEAGVHRRTFFVDRFGKAAERNYWRWKGGQQVSLYAADRYAVALGVHPADLWPEWWEVAA